MEEAHRLSEVLLPHLASLVREKQPFGRVRSEIKVHAFEEGFPLGGKSVGMDMGGWNFFWGT